MPGARSACTLPAPVPTTTMPRAPAVEESVDDLGVDAGVAVHLDDRGSSSSPCGGGGGGGQGRRCRRSGTCRGPTCRSCGPIGRGGSSPPCAAPGPLAAAGRRRARTRRAGSPARRRFGWSAWRIAPVNTIGQRSLAAAPPSSHVRNSVSSRVSVPWVTTTPSWSPVGRASTAARAMPLDAPRVRTPTTGPGRGRGRRCRPDRSRPGRAARRRRANPAPPRPLAGWRSCRRWRRAARSSATDTTVVAPVGGVGNDRKRWRVDAGQGAEARAARVRQHRRRARRRRRDQGHLPRDVGPVARPPGAAVRRVEAVAPRRPPGASTPPARTAPSSTSSRG